MKHLIKSSTMGYLWQARYNSTLTSFMSTNQKAFTLKASMVFRKLSTLEMLGLQTISLFCNIYTNKSQREFIYKQKTNFHWKILITLINFVHDQLSLWSFLPFWSFGNYGPFWSPLENLSLAFLGHQINSLSAFDIRKCSLKG